MRSDQVSRRFSRHTSYDEPRTHVTHDALIVLSRRATSSLVGFPAAPALLLLMHCKFCIVFAPCVFFSLLHPGEERRV